MSSGCQVNTHEHEACDADYQLACKLAAMSNYEPCCNNISGRSLPAPCMPLLPLLLLCLQTHLSDVARLALSALRVYLVAMSRWISASMLLLSLWQTTSLLML
jgi:hypothetical protein